MKGGSSIHRSNLAVKLVELRKQHGYTQQYISDFLNITRQGYANYEHGTRSPDYETLFHIATFYNISLDELLSSADKDALTIENSSYSTEESGRFEIPKHELEEYIDLLSQLSQVQREDYKSMLKATIQNNHLRKKKR